MSGLSRTVVVGLTTLFTLTMFWVGAALAQSDPDLNQPEAWGEDCYKIDESQNSPSWLADQDYRLVVLKAGTENFVFEPVWAGTTLTTGNGKDISHIILCTELVWPTTTTTTTEPPVTYPTTTTVPETTTTTTSSTSTTTVPATVTTVAGAPVPTTTVTPTTTVVIDLIPPVVEEAPPAQPVPGQPTFTG